MTQKKKGVQMSKSEALNKWVEEIAQLTTPDAIYWCDGSLEERERLIDEAVRKGSAIRLNSELRPSSVLFRSDPSDVARVEDRTFICSKTQEEAGPTNNWMDPQEMKAILRDLFKGSMKGRTMYVIPFCMGPIDSPMSIFAVQLTDSPYVVINMGIMTRMGTEALRKIEEGAEFVPCLHGVGYPLEEGQQDIPWPCAPMEKKYISHFPETREIISFGSGYGGNALLGKKCLALRIGSSIAREKGWLAEHMLILKLTNPQGEVFYICGAFPSATGKTNLAMIQPSLPGWKAETVGDDIAWMHFGEDGRLYAINPESGFFGVASGTSTASNPNAMASVSHDTVFTNVALTDEGDVWWEDIDGPVPEHLIDWQGNDWHKGDAWKPAHPNGRFTVAAGQCPSIADNWEDPKGVPIDAILVGGRRPSTIPLVNESFDWDHGVFLGSVLGSEVTAAVISDKIGQVRRDPFAMLPFSGYNIGDYLAHWLEIGDKSSREKLPKIFSVNWFRRDKDKNFLWPGFGDNSRVLDWITRRLKGEVEAVETPIGLLPKIEDLNLEGLDLREGVMEELLEVDKEAWKQELASIRNHYEGYERIPRRLMDQLDALENRLNEA
ncbi:MAG: phosphoenolpyruvate carboxykinase (GTP) [Tissierellia bacterium]|nr:phosphoenolpyruvate carboxykinase (GTP) [Bacillota bacterium]NLL22290.1 phosphoenolpyruvate carboxykinase (GTP) [Tissierellia bacterium]